jgi:hypothetical protein
MTERGSGDGAERDRTACYDQSEDLAGSQTGAEESVGDGPEKCASRDRSCQGARADLGDPAA